MLAWYLSPADFGIVALSTLLIGLFEVLNGFGIPQLIIKDQISDHRHIGYYFFVCIALSAALALLCAACGLFYVQWYRAEVRVALAQVIGISSTGILFSSVGALYHAMYQRDLDFKTPALFFGASLLGGNVLAVAYAASGGGYWALVLRNLAPHVLIMLGFVLFSRYKPVLHRHSRLQSDEKRFSLWLSGNQVVNYLSRNLDYLIIGRFFELQVVGQYSIAYRLMLFPMKFLSSRVQAVLYPTLARMTTDKPAALMDFYVRTVSYIGFISFPLMGFAGVLAPLWVPLFFDSERYHYLVPLVQWLTWAGAFQAVTSPIGSLYLVHNMVRLMAVYSTASAAVFAVGYAVGAWSGDIIVFAAIYTLLSVALNFFVSNYVPLNRLLYPYPSFLRATLEPLLPAMVACLCTGYALQTWWAEATTGSLWALGILGLFFGLTYLLLYRLLFRKSLREKIAKLNPLSP